MRNYKMIDHTADIGIQVYGKTLPELFRASALALFDIMVLQPEKIQTRFEEKISLTANDPEQLLVNWLSEFLFQYDAKRLLFRHFDITITEKLQLHAAAGGEVLDPSRHRMKTEIKAVTYHGLRIEKKDSLYQTILIFDI